MANVKKVHCLFEQSGTFKNEFIRLGIPAEDYDIQNEFGQTDHIVDLFAEIRGGYSGKPSIFDNVGEDEMIMAFFPCTRFECQAQMLLSGNANQCQKMSDEKKLEYSMQTHAELSRLYVLLSQMCVIALRKNIKMVIENPYNQPHYLTYYWCLKPSIIDKDRRIDGDYYKKPTQYWFLNFEPLQNLVFEPIDYVQTMNIERMTNRDGLSRTTMRSMIHPQYARRFILKYLIETENEYATD